MNPIPDHIPEPFCRKFRISSTFNTSRFNPLLFLIFSDFPEMPKFPALPYFSPIYWPKTHENPIFRKNHHFSTETSIFNHNPLKPPISLQKPRFLTPHHIAPHFSIKIWILHGNILPYSTLRYFSAFPSMHLLSFCILLLLLYLLASYRGLYNSLFT